MQLDGIIQRIGHIIRLGLREDPYCALSEEVIVYAFHVIAIDDGSAVQSQDAQGVSQLCDQLLRLPVEPGFLLHIDALDHGSSSRTLGLIPPRSLYPSS